MLSLSVQPSMKGTLTDRPRAVFKNLSSASFSDSFSVKPKASSWHLKFKPLRRVQRLPTAAAAAATELAPEETPTEISDSQLAQEPENIGLGLDQIIPGHGTVPLSPYFFWPRKDAWEELKATLESKPWISQKKMIILLNQATDIINLWQQSGGNLS
ncbi:UNVERIFIED_CONTAM: 30S ribosomal protein 3-1, chloroplastic [Sesamum latifolium]|uniref:30S ribosomal protein 3-1, chloroplastic n=1 Tax=Sesamum latifolium TaxID=2727402 RepID=A0AAW2YCT3_9LAMI